MAVMLQEVNRKLPNNAFTCTGVFYRSRNVQLCYNFEPCVHNCTTYCILSYMFCYGWIIFILVKP